MSHQIIQVAMHEALRDDFEQWLSARGLDLVRTPTFDEPSGVPRAVDDTYDADVIAAYLVTPGAGSLDAPRRRKYGTVVIGSVPWPAVCDHDGVIFYDYHAPGRARCESVYAPEGEPVAESFVASVEAYEAALDRNAGQRGGSSR